MKRSAYLAHSPSASPSKKGSKESSRLSLRTSLSTKELKKQLTHGWKASASVSFKEEKVEVISDPFRVCLLEDFLDDDDDAIEGLKEELMKLKLHQKSNDLYQFKQSSDLNDMKQPMISAFRDELKESCLPLIKEVTGIPLNDTIDLTCSKYDYTDTLLCHDDRLEGRRIAFIYYLTPPTWTLEDGGQLDLFISKDGIPVEVTKSIVPKWNSFIFFEVSPISFHQVREVTSASKSRLSVNGWFHGPSIAYPERDKTTPTFAPPISNEVDFLGKWVNPLYLDVGVASQVKEDFQEDSQIELPNFLLDDKFEAVCDALKMKSVKWKLTGPPNRRKLHIADMNTLPAVAKECFELFNSSAFYLLLSQLTGVDLARDTATNETSSSSTSLPVTSECSSDFEVCGTGSGCVQSMQPGDYTLLYDDDVEEDVFTLDAYIYFGGEGWSTDVGGYMCYVASGEEEDLLTVTPSRNTLSLVYREGDTLRFLKYINVRATEREIETLNMMSFMYQ